jgi:uncharacterized membrane protein YfcA
MIPHLVAFAVLPSVTFAAGILSAITGGSGLVVLPMLLLVGVPPHLALGTNKVYTTSSLFTSAWTFLRRGLFRPRMWLLMIAATLVGSVLGVGLVQLTNSDVLSKILPFFIIAIALYFLFMKLPVKTMAHRINQSKKNKLSVIIGSCLGVYSGFFGAATGTLYTAAGAGFFKMTLLEASAMSRFLAFIANAVGLIVFMVMKEVNYSIGAMLIVMGVGGAYFGTRLALKLKAKWIQLLIVSTSGIMGALLLYNTWFA